MVKTILFNTDIVKAICNGKKTTNRTILKPAGQGRIEITQGKGLWIDKGHIKDCSISMNWIPLREYIERYSRYQVGNILYIMETWSKGKDGFLYKAKGDTPRVWIQITDVRIEKLQDITEEEAKAEGVEKSPFKNATMRFADAETQNREKTEPTYINGFKESWFDSLPEYYLAEMSWGSNPWVWVLEFKKVGKPEQIKERVEKCD